MLYPAFGCLKRDVRQGSGPHQEKRFAFIGIDKSHQFIKDQIVGIFLLRIFSVAGGIVRIGTFIQRASVRVDQPQNPALRLQVMSAVYVAVSRWESRLTLDSITINSNFDGSMVVELAERRNNGVPVSLSVLTGAENGSD